jgi:hypothetical protein
MAEPLEKKLSKKKEKKKIRKQQETLNNISEAKWRKLGSFASWVGYRVDFKGRDEIVPVKKDASRISLMNISNNIKTHILKKKQIENENKNNVKERKYKKSSIK